MSVGQGLPDGKGTNRGQAKEAMLLSVLAALLPSTHNARTHEDTIPPTNPIHTRHTPRNRSPRHAG